MFPSFNDLQFLAGMNALTQDQINMYVKGGAITGAQAKQLGFNVPAQAPKATAAPKSSAPVTSAKSAVNTASAQPAKPSPVAQPSNQNK